MLTTFRTRTAGARAGRSLARKARRRGFRRARLTRTRIAGLGRSDSKKRQARAGWLDTRIDEVEGALATTIEHISTGRRTPVLPKITPQATDAQASTDWLDTILDSIEEKVEDVKDEGKLFKFTYEEKEEAKKKETAKKTKSYFQDIAASPMFPMAIMLAFMAMKG